MPRNSKYTNIDNKLRCIKLAREQLKLEQERVAWEKSCKPLSSGKSEWEFNKEDSYKELLHELDSARYQTALFELRRLILMQRRQNRAAEKRLLNYETPV